MVDKSARGWWELSVRSIQTVSSSQQMGAFSISVIHCRGQDTTKILCGYNGVGEEKEKESEVKWRFKDSNAPHREERRRSSNKKQADVVQKKALAQEALHFK